MKSFISTIEVLRKNDVTISILAALGCVMLMIETINSFSLLELIQDVWNSSF